MGIDWENWGNDVRGLTIGAACGVYAQCSNSAAFSSADPCSRQTRLLMCFRAHNQLLGGIFSQGTNTHKLPEEQIFQKPSFS
jgi:hypothetical protein